MDDHAVQTCLERFRRVPPAQQLLLVGVEPAVAAHFAEKAEAMATLQRAAEVLAAISNAKNPADKLTVRRISRVRVFAIACLIRVLSFATGAGQYVTRD